MVLQKMKLCALYAMQILPFHLWLFLADTGMSSLFTPESCMIFILYSEGVSGLNVRVFGQLYLLSIYYLVFSRTCSGTMFLMSTA